MLRTKDVRSTHRLVVDHIAGVRRIPGLQDATVVLQLESNLAFECQVRISHSLSCHMFLTYMRRLWSQHIIHSLNERGVKKWVALSEGAGGTIGWLTTNERKEAMCFQIRDALRVGNIFLSKHFFSTLMTEHEALKQIRDELTRFAIITEPAKTMFGKVRKTYSGKGGGLNDDLAICLQLAITGHRCFYQSDKYSTFRPEY